MSNWHSGAPDYTLQLQQQESSFDQKLTNALRTLFETNDALLEERQHLMAEVKKWKTRALESERFERDNLELIDEVRRLEIVIEGYEESDVDPSV